MIFFYNIIVRSDDNVVEEKIVRRNYEKLKSFELCGFTTTLELTLLKTAEKDSHHAAAR